MILEYQIKKHEILFRYGGESLFHVLLDLKKIHYRKREIGSPEGELQILSKYKLKDSEVGIQ